jgi:L-lactate dehydrogenase complex protein LldG
MSTREAFLQRVRQAVIEGNRAGTAAPLPRRGQIGYQGGGDDLTARFCTELAAAGGTGHVVASLDDARDKVLTLLRERRARKLLAGCDGLLAQLGGADWLRGCGFDVLAVSDADPNAWREPFFAADVGISNVAHLVAETGSVVMFTRPHDPRSLSLLPPVHIAVARREQILPDLFDLFERFDMELPPACLTIITGPSKTGDIELKLVTGVHGPGEVHVVVLGATDATLGFPARRPGCGRETVGQEISGG